MKHIIFITALLLPSHTGAGTDWLPLLESAYQVGYEDALYAQDDIGLVRLTLKDVEGMI